jgi:hypothetical protein
MQNFAGSVEERISSYHFHIKSMTVASEIEGQFDELQKKYREYLPKVDPALVDDLLLRQMENPSVEPMYMLEVFTKPGLDSDQVRGYIIEKTGMSPAIYDNGTHYVTNQKLSLEVLKEISNSDDVLEVTGEYTGGLGGYGASHEHSGHKTRRIVQAGPARAANAERLVEQAPQPKSGGVKMAAITAAGIIGAIAMAGAIISGGMLPNTNAGAAPVVTGQSVPGVLHGYVSGPGGLPAVGATVIVAGQTTSYHANAFVSVQGQYYLTVPPDEYVVVVAYPDGTNRVVDGFVVGGGSDHRLDF